MPRSVLTLVKPLTADAGFGSCSLSGWRMSCFERQPRSLAPARNRQRDRLHSAAAVVMRKPLDGKDGMRTFGNWQNSGIETASPCQPWQGRSSITSDAFSQWQKKPIRSGWRCSKSEIVACRSPASGNFFASSRRDRTQNDMQ